MHGASQLTSCAYIVREEEREEKPSIASDDGALTTRHRCWYAICEDLHRVSKDQVGSACYCLVEVVPKQMTEEKYEIHFILTFFLESCMKVRLISIVHLMSNIPIVL